MQYISSLPAHNWQTTWPRSVTILGCTGSIGTSALDIIRQQREKFTLVALAAGRNITLLAEQAREFRPAYLGVLDETLVAPLKQRLPAGYSPTIVTGQQGYTALASLAEVSTVLSAQVGAAGLQATLAAAQSGKVIALANKESLVLAGHLIRSICQQTQAVILPVDSEHNAIFQCLAGEKPAAVSKIILTASGGPFRDKTRDELALVTLEQALNHPNWSMGPKITIDSSTLMNKGLEVIEAHHLYGLAIEDIDVVVHKESIIHSLVEYRDGSQLAQLSIPDMRIAIAHCLGWPERLDTGVKKLTLPTIGTLTFSEPDESRFPCLRLAKAALREGRGSTIVLNAANEIAVAAFLNRQIGYLHIAKTVEDALTNHLQSSIVDADLHSAEAIINLDQTTRQYVTQTLG